MDVSALLTSAGINISVTSLLLSVYSILRKQPSNLSVYFGKRLASVGNRLDDSFSLERFASSSSWIVKAWETSEDEILAIGGMDAVIIIRIIVFSIRIFSIAAIICILLVLPVNYYGNDIIHMEISSESLEVFTIANVEEGSKWFWVHCLALHVISWSACVLLYFEYKSITRTRLAHITGSPPDPSHFTVLVRAVPWSSEHSYSDSVKQFFMNYYSSSYLSHQIVYRASTVRKLMNDAENMCQLVKNFSTEEKSKLSLLPCLCGKPNSFEVLSDESDSVRENIGFDISDLASEKEYAVAFVYFKTRYAAIVAAEVLHSENPMLWVTELAPEPNDVLWSNLCIPYRQLWFRKIAILLAAIAFMIVFLAPVAFVQGLTRLHQLSHAFPFLKGMFKQKYIKQLVTGYLPSVILILFQYAVPPTMMLFSTVEGSVSHRSIMGQLNAISSVKIILNQLAAAVPIQASFFMTYVLTSGWASLAVEMVQPLGLVYNTMKKCVCRIKEDQPNGFLSFPYHTEVSKLLMFGFLGFICSVMAPLILPLLLIYFVLAYLVYKNQVLTEMDRQDEQGGRMEEIYQQLRSAYCQFRLISQDLCKSGRMDHQGDQNSIRIHSQ
ncbi:CSC1-like protein RXW8 [Citrus sinensis]|uniref:CSC1-like protein RXW8 n=1 Tax=Citrus sinensis TaxID=2711 RepID=A0ACB8KED5_CITSI|nr:CSC1-like protein RXW8 [Citrus sinensis]